MGPYGQGARAAHRDQDRGAPKVEKAFSVKVVMDTMAAVAHSMTGVDATFSRHRRGLRPPSTKMALWEETEAKAKMETARIACSRMADESQ